MTMSYAKTKAGRARAAEDGARELGFDEVAELYRAANHCFEQGDYRNGNRLMQQAYDLETPLLQKALAQ